MVGSERSSGTAMKQEARLASLPNAVRRFYQRRISRRNLLLAVEVRFIFQQTYCTKNPVLLVDAEGIEPPTSSV